MSDQINHQLDSFLAQLTTTLDQTNGESSELVYKGKAKSLYKTPDENLLLLRFNDDLTAYNAEKKESLAGKGHTNHQISSIIFEYLKKHQVSTHLVKQLSSRYQLVEHLTILPLEVIMRNQAMGSICKRVPVKKGIIFDPPLLEFGYKDDAYGDPFVSERLIIKLGWADSQTLERLEVETIRINQLLCAFFAKLNITLVDFKLEFGLNQQQQLRLGDEISPDTCRLIDNATGESLDKDLFRENLGDVLSGYGQVLSRMQESNDTPS